MLVEEWREYVLCSKGWVDLALFSNFSHLQGLIDKKYTVFPTYCTLRSLRQLAKA